MHQSNDSRHSKFCHSKFDEMNSPTAFPIPSHRMMARRNALISRTSSPIQDTTIKSSTPRKYCRRTATCNAPSTIRDAKAAKRMMRKIEVEKNGEDHRNSFSPSGTDILFDHRYRPLSDHEGNDNFKSWIHFASNELYQFADPTQRSIQILSILHDMKSNNFKFYRTGNEQGILNFREMEDSEVVQLIQMELETRRSLRLSQRSFVAQSAWQDSESENDRHRGKGNKIWLFNHQWKTYGKRMRCCMNIQVKSSYSAELYCWSKCSWVIRQLVVRLAQARSLGHEKLPTKSCNKL